jgi:hypothetical protein
MAKNYSASLNPKNPLQGYIKINDPAGSNIGGFLTASGTIFFTPFFQGHHQHKHAINLPNPIEKIDSSNIGKISR